MRILLFGDGAWAARTLDALVQKRYDIVGVVTRHIGSDDQLAGVARKYRFDIASPKTAGSTDFVGWVRDRKPDLNVSISYDQIIRRELIETAPLGFLNFHAGKLPYYRGRNVINWAILNGEAEIGLTGHYIDEGIDTGDIVLQKTLPIAWTDGYGDVLANVIEAFPGLVMEAISLVKAGMVQRVNQAGSVGTYFPQRTVGDEWLNWCDSSRNLYNKIRAITRPGPGARCFHDGSELIIWKAHYEPAWPSYIANPGQVVGRSDDGVFVKTGDSTILLRECSAVGGDPFIPSWRIGTRLGTMLDSQVHQLKKTIAELERRVSDL